MITCFKVLELEINCKSWRNKLEMTRTTEQASSRSKNVLVWTKIDAAKSGNILLIVVAVIIMANFLQLWHFFATLESFFQNVLTIFMAFMKYIKQLVELYSFIFGFFSLILFTLSYCLLIASWLILLITKFQNVYDSFNNFDCLIVFITK